jgi:type IV secretory pathway TrbD component
MKPRRVDYLTDLAYGVIIFVSVLLIIVVRNAIGIAFGLGVLISYAIHVAWKMARFDPQWMTQEVAENVEETLSEDIDEVIDRLETVNERVDRRPRTDEIQDAVGEMTEGDETVDDIDGRPPTAEVSAED